MEKIKLLYSKIAVGAYQIGFIEDNVYSVVYNDKKYKKVKWVDTMKYKGSWFADPFILNADNNTIEVLAEEYVHSTGLGRISLLSINRKSLILNDVIPLLDLDTHLSFPYIIRKGERIFIIPENNQSGGLHIYEYDAKSKSLINKKTLINKPLVDSQYIELNGIHYIWGLPYANDNFENTKCVDIYRSINLWGPYTLFQTIKSEKKEKRGAGAIFELNGRLIRPTQCCEGGYGKGVIFWEIEFDESNYFVEKEIGKMRPHLDSKYPLQLHTYNEYNGL